jgi:hypothetical protein
VYRLTRSMTQSTSPYPSRSSTSPSSPTSPSQAADTLSYPPAQHAAYLTAYSAITRLAATVSRQQHDYDTAQQRLQHAVDSFNTNLSRLHLLSSSASASAAASSASLASVSALNLFPSLPSLLHIRLMQELDLAMSIISSALTSCASVIAAVQSAHIAAQTAAASIPVSMLTLPPALLQQSSPSPAKGSSHKKQRPAARDRGEKDQGGGSDPQLTDAPPQPSVLEQLLRIEDRYHSLCSHYQQQSHEYSTQQTSSLSSPLVFTVPAHTD